MTVVDTPDWHRVGTAEANGLEDTHLTNYYRPSTNGEEAVITARMGSIADMRRRIEKEEHRADQ